MTFVVNRLQDLRQRQGIPLYMCFINLTKAYDSADRTLLWTVLQLFVVPPSVLSVCRQFHDNMRRCVRTDDGVCSVWCSVEQGLRQGCVLAPLLFDIFFTAVLNAAPASFHLDPDIVEDMVTYTKKYVVGGQERSSARRPWTRKVPPRRCGVWWCTRTTRASCRSRLVD